MRWFGLDEKERNESGEKRKGEEILKKKDFFGK